MIVYIYDQNLKKIAAVFCESIDCFTTDPTKFFPNWEDNMHISETEYQDPILDGDTLRDKTRAEKILDGNDDLLIEGEYISDNEIKIKEKPTDMISPTWNKDTIEWKETATIQEKTKIYMNKIQKMLDEAAIGDGYDSCNNAISYKNSVIDRFADDADRYQTWRDKTWYTANSIMMNYKSGKIEEPTLEYVMSKLPKLEPRPDRFKYEGE